MKKNFRYIVFLILMIFASFGTRLSPSSSAAPQQRPIDPACVSQCSFLLFQCFAAGGKNGNENACISVYRHCIAQCGKHD
jgi:predicted Na+-dependent transporter